MFDKQKTVGKLSFTIYTNRNQTKTLVRQTADRQTENQIERQTESRQKGRQIDSCSTTRKPAHLFQTKCASLDSV